MTTLECYIDSPRKTRLAPSPTGALHLGNARTFLINWALAKQNNWEIILRIEDLDTPRVKAGADIQAIDDLQWLGLSWDEGPVFQLADLSPYQTALDQLAQDHKIYPCVCTRQEIERAQTAPHAGEHELRYHGTCRPANLSTPFDVSSQSSWRVIAPSREIIFTDSIAGQQRFDLDRLVGDFVVATKAGLPAYQLAVVVDDVRQGVTDIVRGDDLLSSAARQRWLYELLGYSPLPQYWHVPLVLGSDGRRLAKRHGDSRLATYRKLNVPVERIIGLLAYWSGVEATRQPLSAVEFAERFSLARLPRQPAMFTYEDHSWILER